ncbi:unnamed protein product [Brachionus calyciflorus]|uniref:Cupin type-2 domain-containing protein n=1 Tax=Brachionus calyciflorus TaxID=104777 RepID=A0A814II22_9BILA|nr:unnamed protein product [Brachionus calyciflorus]
MKVIKLNDCEEIIAGDKTLLREIFNPLKEKLDINYSLARALILPGTSSQPHSLEAVEVFYIIRGKGEMHIDDEVQVVEPGDTVYIPANAVQWIVNKFDETLEFLALVEPSWNKKIEHVNESKTS